MTQHALRGFAADPCGTICWMFWRSRRDDIREMLTENRAMIAELRELRLASERRWDESERRYRDEVQITREVIRRNELAFQRAQEAQAEMIAELRAQRQGFLALIDELRGGGANPATS